MSYRFLQLVPPPTSNSASKVVSGNQLLNPGVNVAHGTATERDRRQNNLLQERIHRLTDGSVPAFRALAEVSSILQSDYRVQRILRAEIAAPKVSIETRKARVKGGTSQEAALLTRTVRRDPLRLIQGTGDHLNGHGGGRRGTWRGGIDENMNKENIECAGSPSVVCNLQSELSNSIDDIPIGRWREPALVAQMGAPRTLSQRSEHSAAKSLLGSSQPRCVGRRGGTQIVPDEVCDVTKTSLLSAKKIEFDIENKEYVRFLNVPKLCRWERYSTGE